MPLRADRNKARRRDGDDLATRLGDDLEEPGERAERGQHTDIVIEDESGQTMPSPAVAYDNARVDVARQRVCPGVRGRMVRENERRDVEPVRYDLDTERTHIEVAVVVAGDQQHVEMRVGAAPRTYTFHPSALFRGRAMDEVAEHDETFRYEFADQAIESRKIVIRIAAWYGDARATEDRALAEVHVRDEQGSSRLPVDRALRMQGQPLAGDIDIVRHHGSASASSVARIRSTRLFQSSVAMPPRRRSTQSGKARGLSRFGSRQSRRERATRNKQARSRV